MKNPLNFIDRVAVVFVIALIAGAIVLFAVANPSPALLLECIFGGLALALISAFVSRSLSFSLSTPQRQTFTLLAGALILSCSAIAITRRFDPDKGLRAVQAAQQLASNVQRNSADPRVVEDSRVKQNLAAAVGETIRQREQCVERGGPDARACAEDGRKNVSWAQDQVKAGNPPDTSPEPPPQPQGGGATPSPNPNTPSPEQPIAAPSRTPGLESSPIQQLLEALASPFGQLLKSLMSFGSSEEYMAALRQLAAQISTTTPADPTTVRAVLANADDAQKAFSSMAQLASRLPAAQQVALRAALTSSAPVVLKSPRLEDIVRRLDAGETPQSVVDLLPDKQFASPAQKLALQTVLIATGRKDIWVSVFQDLPPK